MTDQQQQLQPQHHQLQPNQNQPIQSYPQQNPQMMPPNQQRTAVMQGIQQIPPGQRAMMPPGGPQGGNTGMPGQTISQGGVPPQMIAGSRGAQGIQQIPGQPMPQIGPNGQVLPPGTQGAMHPGINPMIQNSQQLPQNYPMRSMSQMGGANYQVRSGDRVDQYAQEQSRNLMITQKQNLSKYIKEEIVNFSYTQLPNQLDELYNIQHSSVYKAIYNQSAFGGKRVQKLEEPQIQASHYDFLLAEMTNMALDFQEESFYKKVLSVKLAREAQSELLIRREIKRQREKLEEEERLRAQQLEEQKLQQERIQQQLIDEVQEQNAFALNLGGEIQNFNQPSLQLDEMLLPESQNLQIKVSLSGLLRNDSLLMPNNENNNLSSAFGDDPLFFEQNQNDGLNVVDNDFGVGDDNHLMFQSQNQGDGEMMIDNLEPQPDNDLNILPELNMMPILDDQALQLPLLNQVQLPRFPKSDVLIDIFDFEKPEKNVLDQIEMFYLVPDQKQLHQQSHNQIEYEEFNQLVKPRANEKIQQQTGFVKQDNFLDKTDQVFKNLKRNKENKDPDHQMQVDETLEITESLLDHQLTKFKDILIMDYVSKQENKRLREQQKDLQQQLARQEPIDPELLNVDSFVAMDPYKQQQIQQMQQQQQERQNMQNSLQKINSQLNQAKQNQMTQQLNLSFKKMKISVYEPHDIFTQAMEDSDFADLPTYDAEVVENDQQKVQEEQKIEQDFVEQINTNIQRQSEQNQPEEFKNKDVKKYLRPNEENPFSEDDLEFMSSIPDNQSSEYFQLFLKSLLERQRKQNVYELEKSNNPAKQQQIRQELAEDYLLMPERLARQAMKKLILRNNLNPQITYDYEKIKTFFAKSFFNKKGLSNLEQAFMYWYLSIFGDEWKVIADVINYHPMTKGGTRDPEELKSYFFYFDNIEGLNSHQKIPIEPWRFTDMPMLINQRPPSLLNSVHQHCLIHQNNIRAYLKSMSQNKNLYRIKVDSDEKGKLILRSNQTTKKILGEEKQEVKEKQMVQQKDDESVIGKRNHSQSAFLEENEQSQSRKKLSSNSAHTLNNQNQSLAQIPLDGTSASMVIDQEFQTQIVKNQFEIQAEINENFQEQLSYRVAEISKKTKGMENGAQLSFYEFYDKFYTGGGASFSKRRKVEDEKVQNWVPNDIKSRMEQNQYTLASKLDPNERNTPMINALTFKLKGDDGQTNEYYQRSIFNKTTMSYWIAYLLKKLYQQDKDLILKYKNQNLLEQHEIGPKTVLSNRVNKAAQESARIQKTQARGVPVVTQEEQESQAKIRNITESMRTYEIESSVADIVSIGDIWGGKTIFCYDQASAIQQINQDCENTADRPPEVLRQIWDRKWETMDYYWFQKHKHLGPNEKKKDPSAKFAELFNRSAQISNQQNPGPQYSNNGVSQSQIPPGMGPPPSSGMPDPQSVPSGNDTTAESTMNTNIGHPQSREAPQQMPQQYQGGQQMPGGQSINMMRSHQQMAQQQQIARQQQQMQQTGSYLPQNGLPQGGMPGGAPGGAAMMQQRGPVGSQPLMSRQQAQGMPGNVMPNSYQIPQGGLPPNYQ